MKNLITIILLLSCIIASGQVKTRVLNFVGGSSVPGSVYDSIASVKAIAIAARDSASKANDSIASAKSVAIAARDSASKANDSIRASGINPPDIWTTSDGSNRVWVATPTGRQVIDLVRTAVGTTSGTCLTVDFSSVTTGTTYTTNQCYRVIDAEGEYGDLVYKTVRINISGAAGLQISTQLANTENPYDYLKVYNTSDVVNPIATLTGSNTITIDASNDITLEWNSDNGNGGLTYNGFEITVAPL